MKHIEIKMGQDTATVPIEQLTFIRTITATLANHENNIYKDTDEIWWPENYQGMYSDEVHKNNLDRFDDYLHIHWNGRNESERISYINIIEVEEIL